MPRDQRIGENIADDWGRRIVEVQVRYDSARLQRPLQREIALAFQTAESNALRQWVLAGEDASLTDAALAEMESFRRNFRDDADVLQTAAERIRTTIEREARSIDGQAVTASVGATLARSGETIQSVLQRADEALYEAKQAGRNCSRAILWGKRGSTHPGTPSRIVPDPKT